MKRRFVTPEMVEQMKRLETEGKSRREIADLLDVTPATVTRSLGAVRPYRSFRLRVAEGST